MNKVIMGALVPAVFVLGLWSLSYSSTEFLEAKTYQGISYLSGGIGTEEREALRAKENEFNLRLSFASQNSEYLGGAQVVVKDKKGKTVLDATADGPLFFAELPQGSYTVTATALGKTFRREARISAKGRAQLHFTWKESDHETPTESVASK
jgi:hypothetical protein